MAFIIDKQTLNDLNLLGKYKPNSIFSIYNNTITKGGGAILEKMFLEPLTDHQSINLRSDIFKYFTTLDISLPFKRKEFEVFEQYVNTPNNPSIIVTALIISRRMFASLSVKGEEYGLMQSGIINTLAILIKIKELIKSVEVGSSKLTISDEIIWAQSFLNDKWVSGTLERFNLSEQLTLRQTIYLDHKLRYTHFHNIQRLIALINQIDVYIAVSKVANERGFIFAKADNSEQSCLDIRLVYHPSINKAIPNDIYINHLSNVLFLTGANMAGKSTFMKSFGIAVYLAHMGFPVAAKSMTFTVQDGMFTSINVPDDLNAGYSHFYAEVMRVKNIAIEVSSGKRYVIMFDELFKGTNVKDAYDATVAVTEAFSKKNRSSFVVSTHIMEAGNTLKERCSNMQFKYLPTIMKGGMPTYTYTLDNGIADDRHGMMIINNERIIEIIKQKKI